MYQLTYNKDNDRLVLQFPYKVEDYAFASSLEGRPAMWAPPALGDLTALSIQPSKWNSGLLRKHCFPLALTPAAKARLEATDDALDDASANTYSEDPVITDWTFYRTPFKHQMLAWKYAVDNPFAALFLEMGLGKTFVSYNVLGYFRKVKLDPRPSLVVIPLSSFESWEREARLCGFEGKVVSVHGSKVRKTSLLRGEGDVFLVTYESLTNLLEIAKEKQWLYIILDESTKIKNANAVRSKTLYDLRDHASRRILLSGYPVTQSYVDLFGQYKFLDPTIYGTSFHKFRTEYCRLGGFTGREIVGYQNLRGLVDNMAKRCVRFTKKQCLDLPEKTYQVFRFDLSDAERKAYDELKRQLVLRFNESEQQRSAVTAQNALVAGLRLVQICTGYVGGIEALPGAEAVAPMQQLGDSKLKLLEEALENVPKDEKIIIWCRFKHNLRQVAGLLTSNNIKFVSFSGELGPKERIAAIERFQNGDARVFLGIIQAGGHGINLTAASYVVYYSQDYSIERRVQSEDRAHRIGQQRNVTYIDLVARGTLEESILTCLRSKRRESEVVFEFQRDPTKFLEGDIGS